MGRHHTSHSTETNVEGVFSTTQLERERERERETIKRGVFPTFSR